MASNETENNYILNLFIYLSWFLILIFGTALFYTALDGGNIRENMQLVTPWIAILISASILAQNPELSEDANSQDN